ncbi:phosphotransferase family protein [Williamsia sp. DF01-3]|uniref:phosphotransferase family protein n=1 Tax=Williamsia sp. DF01-3 TaxID=2934157 RepID=UPI001FF344AC|nr:phosphotransferase family protein [Williamsia sp. DF01-3]MCK0516780.1 phosphotransferase family protein [Williamsia sp. DF01-3]
MQTTGHNETVPTDDDVEKWLTETLGEVTFLSRQARWRPVWFADVERDGTVLELCIRGERVDSASAFPLEHEMKFQSVLQDADIPVPKVYGWSSEPKFYAMDRVTGEADFARSTDAERRAVVEEYVGILARIHALDVDRFSDVGITRAGNPSDSSRPGIKAFGDSYRASKVRPDPLMEWGLAWFDRNPLDSKGRETAVVWDSGQFMHSDGKINAIIDVELGHVGDPMMDLAAWRARDTVMNYGKFDELYRRYEEQGGQPVDLDAIEYYNMAFSLTNQLAFHKALAEPPLGSAYMTNLQWCAETNVMMVEAFADAWEISLEALATPTNGQSPAREAYAHLVASLRHFPAGDEQSKYEARLAFRLARHLQRVNEIGPILDQANLDDLEQLLGSRPASPQAGDAALEEFVLKNDGAHDKELLHLFNRHCQRAQMLLGPAGSAMVTHHKPQPFTHH